MASVFIVQHTMFGSSFRGGGTTTTILGTYASRALAQQTIDELRRKILLTDGDHLRVTNHADGRGFSYGSVHGSMTFIPGAYSILEQEVIS